jgi:hypothetical protein
MKKNQTPILRKKPAIILEKNLLANISAKCFIIRDIINN